MLRGGEAVELHQLQYFVAVAEMGSFSKAARRCSVAQPSLSQQIIKLEHELGQRLFERLGRSVILTAAGQALLPQAQRILSEVQSIKSGIADAVSTGRGRLAVGFIPTLAPYVLPHALACFAQRFPEAELEMLEHTTDALVERLVALELDICFLSLPLKHRLIEIEELHSEPLLLALPHNHPLAGQPALSVERLRDSPFIALNEDNCLSQQVDAFCYEQQIAPSVVCRVAHLATLQSCVAAGMGVALVPAMLVQADQAERCVYRPLADAAPRRTIVAAWHSSRGRSALAGEFMGCVRSCLEGLGARG
ncbi:MAG: LysR family transcriptional regulator [Roseiflexaceae bacterium]